MLVRTVREGETVRIGEHVTVRLVESHEGSAKISVNAPRDVKILHVTETTERAPVADSRVE